MTFLPVQIGLGVGIPVTLILIVIIFVLVAVLICTICIMKQDGRVHDRQCTCNNCKQLK